MRSVAEPRVTALSVTPVKGTRLHVVQRIRLDPDGVRENRRFYLIDERDRLANGKRLGALNTVISDYDDAGRRLVLRFPDGSAVEGDIRLGEVIATKFYSQTARGQIVHGPFAGALSELVGEPVRLVEAIDPGGAVDRGAGGAASLISRASLARLAGEARQPDVDARRFRMLVEIDGVQAHAEDAWVGRQVTVGGAVIALRGHVGRCLITSRHPESGEIDLPTLDILRDYRGEEPSTEPLPFGVYGNVVRGGEITVGDTVAPVPTS
jgi:uncharacterized protein YcbX